MATVQIAIGGRSFSLTCADGEEQQIEKLAAIIDAKAREATDSFGGLSESRMLLFASLMLADDLATVEADTSPPVANNETVSSDPETSRNAELAANALEKLAERMENLAISLEQMADRP